MLAASGLLYLCLQLVRGDDSLNSGRSLLVDSSYHLSLVQLRASTSTPDNVANELEAASDSAEPTCIEDMCFDITGNMEYESRHDVVTDGVFAEEHDGGDLLDLAEDAYCSSAIDPNKRTIITAVVEAFHGSTALEEIMMSSQQVSTPCACGTWQCEVRWLPAIYDAGNGNAFNWDYTSMLGAVGDCWNLDRHVLFQKFMLGNHCPMPYPEGERTGVDNHCRVKALQAFTQHMAVAPLPGNFLQKGIHEINSVHVLMWRPICMAKLSAYSKDLIDKGFTQILAFQEVIALQEMVSMHKFLKGIGARVVVMSLGDLVWRPSETRQRLLKLLPCLGDVDIDYKPVLGSDGSELKRSNQFKATGSVKEYGHHVDPTGFYDVPSGKCINTDVIQHLNETQQEEAKEAAAYLREASRAKDGGSFN